MGGKSRGLVVLGMKVLRTCSTGDEILRTCSTGDESPEGV